jgi:cytochrome c551/c552
MPKLNSPAVGSLSFLLLGLAAVPAYALTMGEGRTLFAQQGCAECHAYVGQIGAASAKQMSKRYAGDAAGLMAAFAAAPDHKKDTNPTKVSAENLRLLSEWMAGGPAPAASSTAPLPVPPVAVAPAVPSVRVSGGSASDGKASERVARTQEADQRAKREAEAKAKKDALLAQKREADERAKQAAEARARRADEEQAALKKAAEEKAKRAVEARAKREAEAQAAAKREADELARRAAEAKAKNDVEAEAALKREAEARAKRTAQERTQREAEAQAAAKREAEEQARRAAEAKAKREVEEQTALKREGEERARREAELKAKQEAEAKARREADAKAEAQAKPIARADGESRGKGGKAPEKFRDDPCPPISAPVSLAAVDEEKAKQVMERVDCSGCHAFVQKKTGPPFKRVFEKVKGNPECVVERLKKGKEHNEEGVTDELKGPEFKIVADYMATRAK